jgi:hypothetical protein
MALVLLKEDGSGKADANAYASVADGDAYHEGHLYAAAWTGATAEKKAAALVMASRLIDSCVRFNGARATEVQALAWPRAGCPDPEGGVAAVVADDAVPRAVVEATCETARALLIEDRTGNPEGEGLSFVTLGDMQESFDKADRRPMVPQLAQSMLARYGRTERGGSGVAQLVRA